MKSILIAIDESEASKAALSVGVEIGIISEAKIKGLYVEDILRLLEWQTPALMGAAIGLASGIPDSRPTEEQVEVEKQFIKEGMHLKKLFDETCQSLGAQGSFSTVRGKIDEQIIEIAKTVDLVVLGKSSKVAENLLRHTSRPTLVVPPNAKFTNHILIAYDGSETSQRALSAGAQFAKLQPSLVEVISISDHTEQANKSLKEAKDYLSAYELNVNYSISRGSNKPWDAILDKAKTFKAGLIVLGAFGNNKLLELIFGSTTREVLVQATCPVLLTR